MSDGYIVTTQKEYYMYHDDKNNDNYYIENIQPTNNHQIVIHNNNTDYSNLNDTSFMLMTILLHFIFILFLFEIGKKIYRTIYRNRDNERLVINPNPNYYHNKVILVDEISEEPCSICLDQLYNKDDIENNKSIISLKCNHMFHKECIDPWVINNKCCPLCKRNT